jgi:ribosome biogenesis protein UTP30
VSSFFAVDLRSVRKIEKYFDPSIIIYILTDLIIHLSINPYTFSHITMVMVEAKSTGHPTVDSELLKSAFAALVNHHKGSTAQSSCLLGDDLPVELQFTLTRVPEKVSPRPYRLQIPHPLHKVLNKGESDQGLDEIEVCLFVKDGSKEWVKDLIEKFPNEMGYIKKVLTLTSLRKKYVQYKDRRELLKRYDIFLADDRILPMLGKSVGKSFFQEKKQPVPIRLTRQEALPFAVKRCLRSTFMWISAGTCLSVRAGNTGMPLEHLVSNANAIIENAVEHIPRKWSNVSSINIKTSQSVALPVYNKTREELEEISRLAKQGIKGCETKRPCPDQDEDERAQKKKKVDKEMTAKSPLLKALKKSRKSDGDYSAEIDPLKKDSPLEPSSKKAKKLSNMDTEANSISSSGDSNGEKKKSKTSTPTEVLKKKSKTTDDKKEKHSPVQVNEVGASIKSKEKDPSKGKKKQEKNKQVEVNKSFVPSKKFQGSKKGYVFRMGKEGLGYYVDVKPVPDKMALMAFSRMNKGGTKAGNNGGKSRKTTRRGR